MRPRYTGYTSSSSTTAHIMPSPPSSPMRSGSTASDTSSTVSYLTKQMDNHNLHDTFTTSPFTSTFESYSAFANAEELSPLSLWPTANSSTADDCPSPSSAPSPSPFNFDDWSAPSPTSSPSWLSFPTQQSSHRVRRQRQDAVRRQCDVTHLREIALMVARRDMCTVCNVSDKLSGSAVDDELDDGPDSQALEKMDLGDGYEVEHSSNLVKVASVASLRAMRGKTKSRSRVVRGRR